MTGYSSIQREVRESWVGQWSPSTIGYWNASDLRRIVLDLDTNDVPDDAPITFRSRTANQVSVHDVVLVAGDTRAVLIPPNALRPGDESGQDTSG